MQRILYFLLIYLIVFIFLSTTKMEWIPDCFSLSLQKNPHDFFNLIISSLASLSGIIIAGLIISFEILKEKIDRNLKPYFFGNKYLIIYISIFIVSITTPFLSKIVVHENYPQNNVTNLLYFNSFLFLLCLLTFIPLTIKILFSLKISEVIKYQSKLIDIQELKDLATLPEYVAGVNFFERNEEHPLIVLKDLAVNYLPKRYAISRLIIREVSFQIIKIFEGHKNEKKPFEIQKRELTNGYLLVSGIEIFNPYIEFINRIIRKSQLVGETNIKIDVLYDLFFVISELIRMGVGLEYLKGLWKLYINILTTINPNSSDCYSGFDLLNKILILTLTENNFKKEEISDFYKYTGKKRNGYIPTAADMWWVCIDDDFVGVYRDLAEKAVEKRDDKFLAHSISYAIDFLSEINKSSGIGPIIKEKINIHVYEEISHYLGKAIKMGLNSFEISFSIENLGNIRFLRSLKENKNRNLRHSLLTFGNFLIEALQQKSLNQLSFNGLNLFIYDCKELYNENRLYRESYHYIIKFFKHIKEEIEATGIEKQIDIYKKIKQIMEFLKMETTIQKHINELNELLDSFQDSPKSGWVDGHGYIRWEEEE